jgi:hypothetical protein
VKKCQQKDFKNTCWRTTKEICPTILIASTIGLQNFNLVAIGGITAH